MQFNWLLQLLGWLAFPLLAALGGVLLWRRAYREFPIFFAYVLTALLLGALRWIAFSISYRTYYFTYWTSDVLLAAFSLAVIFDLFAKRLFAGYQRVKFYRAAVFIAIALALVLTIAALEIPSRTTIFLIASRVLSLLAVGLLAFFGILMVIFGRSWTNHEVGIASGFAISQCADLLASLVAIKVHYRVTLFDQLPVWAYDAACVIWIVYCWKPPEQRGATPIEREWLDEAKRVEQHLRDWLSRRRCF